MSFLGRLRWHVFGLSEVALKQRLLLLLAPESLAFYISSVSRAIYTYLPFSVGPLFLYHVRASCRAHSVSQYCKHSTAQRNQPALSRKASTYRSECDKASTQSWGELAHTFRGALYSLGSRNERRDRNLLSPQKYSGETTGSSDARWICR